MPESTRTRIPRAVDNFRSAEDWRFQVAGELRVQRPWRTSSPAMPALGFGIVGNPMRNYRTTSYGPFAQDDWRIKPKMTLNLGLRWEYTNPVSEANNLLADFVPGSPTGMVQVGQGISSPYNRAEDQLCTALRCGLGHFRKRNDRNSGRGRPVLRYARRLAYFLTRRPIFENVTHARYR